MFWRVFLILLIMVISNYAQFDYNSISGTYYIGNPWFSNQIKLNKDGTYSVLNSSDHCEINPNDPTDCLNWYKESGNFSISGTTIKFNILEFRRFGLEGKLKDAPPQTYEKSIVKWSDRIYLIEKDGFMQFINSINMGVEPRKTTIVIFYNFFFLRMEDVSKPISGLPDLVEKWNGFYLKTPVNSKILAIETQNGEQVAIINKGSESGLKIGMVMGGDCSFEALKIISAEKNTSTLKMKGNLKVGEEISTSFGSECVIRSLPKFE